MPTSRPAAGPNREVSAATPAPAHHTASDSLSAAAMANLFARNQLTCLAALLCLGAVAVPRGHAAELALAGSAEFEQSVRPLLAEHCWKCHGPEKQKAGLRLDSRAA